jgi:DNA-binding transcriptional MocR family regulator
MLTKSLEILGRRGQSGGLPRYRTAVGAIRSFIVENKLKPGDRLSSCCELLKRLDISNGTVQRALGILQNEGWIDRQIPRHPLIIAWRLRSSLRLCKVMLDGSNLSYSKGD